jgi:hypothetical protein
LRALNSRNAAFAAHGVLLVLPTLVFGWRERRPQRWVNYQAPRRWRVRI